MIKQHLLCRLVSSCISATTYLEFLNSLSNEELEILKNLGSHVTDIANKEIAKRSIKEL
jgi:hypothetical protein